MPSTVETQPPTHYLEWSDRGRAELWRYLVGAVLVLTISLFVGQVFSAFGGTLISSDSAAATIVKTTLFGFVVSFFLVPLVPRLVNRRPWWSIAMGSRHVGAGNLALGAAIVLVVLTVLNVVFWALDPQAYQWAGADLGVWVPMLVVAAVAFFVQTATEEMVYRGYLTQFARRFATSPVVFLVLPALVFAAPHAGNISGVQGPLALAPYVVAGLGYGWLAFRSGSLWMSVGAHLANNWFITMFVGSRAEGIQKISLITTSGGDQSGTRFVVGALVLWVPVVVLAEVVLRVTGRLVRIGPSDRQAVASGHSRTSQSA